MRFNSVTYFIFLIVFTFCFTPLGAQKSALVVPPYAIGVDLSLPLPQNMGNFDKFLVKNELGSINISEGEKPQIFVTGYIAKEDLKNLSPEAWLSERLSYQDNKLSIVFDSVNISKKTIKVFEQIPSRSKRSTIQTSGTVLNLDIKLPKRKKIEAKNLSAFIEINGDYDVDEAESVKGKIAIIGASGDDTDIKTTSGSIIIDNCDLTSLELETVSGNITIKNSKFKDLDADSTSGNITFENIKVVDGSIDVETTSGEITIKAADIRKTELDADSKSGNIVISNIQVSKDTSVETETISGNTQINRVNGSWKKAKAKSVSGKIRLDWSKERSGKKSIEILSGKDGAEFESKTVSGDINYR